jgi:hypothetical protein
MAVSSDTPTPLIGALFIAEGLVSAAQLTHCLHIQATELEHMPLGQILFAQGYISQAGLAHIVAMQQKLRASTRAAFETLQGEFDGSSKWRVT